MDVNEYEKEIRRLDNEIQELAQDTSSDEPRPSPALGFMKYKNYFFFAIGTFLFLLITRPKWVLKIVLIDSIPTIVVNKSKFALVWVAMTCVCSLAYFAYLKTKKLS